MTKLTAFVILGMILLITIAIVLDILKGRKNNIRYKISNVTIAYMFFLPALILITIFVIQPIVMSLWYGFTDYYLLKPDDINIIGLQNFKDIINQYKAHGDIYHALRNTLQFMIFVLPLQIGLALGLSLILNKSRKGNAYFKVAFFAPVVMSLTVISILWMRILDANPSELGLMNTIYTLIGLPPQKFLLDSKMAMYWIVIISAWQGAGFQMLIFLAGLKNIPNEVYDAAEVDGADKFEILRFITLPSLKSTFVFVSFTTLIGASKILTQPMLMIGFKNYSMTLSYLIYREGFQFRFVGYASAIALLVSIFVGVIVYLQRRLTRERGDIIE